MLFVVSGIYPFRCPSRSVVMFHSLLPFEEEAVNLYRGEKKYMKYRLLNFLYKRSMQRADGLLFSSKFTEEKFLQTFSSSDRPVSKVIPFGTWSSFRESARTDSTGTGSTIRFLYVSNFYRYKRHMMLIPLFEKLIREGNDISLTLCGDGYVREGEIKNAVKESGCQERIKYIGKLDHDNMQELYQEHDVLIFPSIVESFGIPLIEAAHENLWILFTWPPLVEIMQNNSYERYTLAEDNLDEDIKHLLKFHAEGKINLKEKKVNTHFIPFTQTASETMKYLESFLSGL